MSQFTRSILLAMGLVGLSTTAPAQYYPPNPYNPYYPPGYGGFGPGNVLNGQANVISASGDLYVKQEQARIQREQAYQAKIDTKRKTFDEMMYEKANTPTFTEEQSKVQAMQLRRVMTSPVEAEIISGKAQNLILPYLDSLCRGGIQGPPIMLDPDMLKLVNVSTGKAGPGIGVLKDAGHMEWPLALRGPTQKKLDKSLPKLVAGVATGDLDAALYTEAAKGVAALTDELKKKFHKEEIDGGLYLEGKRFMDSLDGSMKAIRQPGAAKLLNGTYAATGRSIPELVYNMTMKGLKFAPATPGNEAPYFSLHTAMVSYANGSQTASGFQAQYQQLAYPKRQDYTNLPR